MSFFAKSTTLTSGAKVRQSENNRQAIKVFYTRSLDAIIKLAKKFPTTKDACNKILASIKEMDEMGKNVVQDMSNCPNKYFEPLKISCETRNPQIMDAALNCIEKLMAYSLIDDHQPYESYNSFSMVDIAIQTICLCFDPNQDENVQLQIIKGLNTAVASCTVRGKALQLAVKTCFIIHLVSKNVINQKTALSTVSHILATVFQNLENHVNDDEEIVDDEEDLPDSEVYSFVTSTPKDGSTTSRVSITEVSGLTRSNSNSSLNSNSSYDVSALNGAPATISVDSDRVSTPLTTNDDKGPSDNLEKFVGDIIDEKEFKNNVLAVTDREPSNVKNPDNHYRQDAYLVLKELCQLSIKKLATINNLENSIQMRTRVAAMQLLIDILENSGPGFRSSKSFVREIRKHLCMTILVNGLATHATIFDKAVTILKILIQHFKAHLKLEIGSFLTDVFLKILNSPNSTCHQKVTIMQFLQSLAQDNQTFFDLFLNYDCSLEYKVNVFEVTMENISQAIINVHAEPNWMTAQQEATLKLHGLQTIVSLLNMLVELHKKRIKELQENVEGILHKGREFEISRRKKIDLKEGIRLFNDKDTNVNKGIDFLVRTGHLKRDPIEVARFLSIQSGLKKDRIGLFIGQRESFNSQTLKAFVELQDYKGLDLEFAFRNYLNTFRIPGEGQVIDRIVEAFADRYYQQNKENSIFASHDATHIFAFSILMLNTELHSPALGVRPRMDLQGFINNNRSINDGQDLDKDYLTKIFNNIKENEIKLQEEVEMLQEQSTESLLINVPLLKRKQILYDRETDKIIKNTKNILGDNRKFVNQDRNSTTFDFFENVSATPHISAMFEISWKSILNSLEHLYDLIVDEKQFMQLCIRAFECGIHIAARYDLDNARSAFVNCVARNADLPALPIEVRLLQKNVNCIKLLLKLVDIEGDYLRDSWEPVLNCVSQLEFLIEILKGKNGVYASQYTQIQQMEKLIKDQQLFSQQRSSQNGSTIMRDMLGAISPNNQGNLGGIGGQGALLYSGSNSVLNNSGQAIDYINAKGLMQQLDSHLIDTIFIKSAELSNDAVVDFVKALCSVSLHKEINAPPISITAFTESRSTPSTTNTPSAVAPSNGTQTIATTPTPRETSNRNSANACLIDSMLQIQQQLAQHEPRKFSLQKLTEVAYFNMSRKEKIVWALIWYYMAEHFVAVGCHSNECIANYAIEAARQLVLSFMDHEEMLEAIPNFQISLVNPFLKIVQQSKSHIVREVIVKCAGIVISERHELLKNGWKTALDIISTAVQISDTDVQFITNTYKEYLENLIMAKSEYFNAICEAKAFPDLVICLLAFAKKLPAICEEAKKVLPTEELKSRTEESKKRRPISTDAIEAIATCANHLGTGNLRGVRENQEKDMIGFTDCKLDVGLWFPILQGLCKLVSDDSRPEVRKSALSTVTQILKTHGGKFDGKLWSTIFSQLLCRIFDNIQPQHPTTIETKEDKKNEEVSFKPPTSRWKGLSSNAATNTEPSKSDTEKVEEEEKQQEPQIERSVVSNDSMWVRTTCEQALLNIVELFDHFYDLISFVFDDLLKLILSCFKQDNGNKITLSGRLAKIGQNVLMSLVDMSGSKLSSSQWDLICLSVSKMLMTDMNAVAAVISSFTPKEGTDKASSTLASTLSNSAMTYINTQGQIHCQLIQIIKQILLSQLHNKNTTLKIEHIKQLLNMLYSSYSAAKSLNESEIVARSKSNGISSLPLKMFLDQEIAAVGVYLALILKMLSRPSIECARLEEPCLRLAEELLAPISNELLLRYLTKAEIIKETEEYKAINSSEMIELIPIVVQVLNGLSNDCSNEQFKRYVDFLYEPLSNLVLSEHRVIRVSLRHVFQKMKDF